MSDEKALTIVEGRIGDALLEKYDPKQYHVIIPTQVVTFPEDVMELEVSVVKLSPNPKDKMVYPFPEAGEGMMAIAKKGLEAIANAAGLDDEDSREIAYVPGKYAICEATVAVRLPSGDIVRRKRQKSFDVESRMEEFEYNLRNKISSWKKQQRETGEQFDRRKEAYLEEKLTKRRLQLQKFMWELANTGAQLRAMRALLPSLKEVYHIKDLEKAFIVPRITARPAVVSSRLLQAAAEARARRDITHLFGPIDLYEELNGDLATELREKDEALAEIADALDNGDLAREAIGDEIEPVQPPLGSGAIAKGEWTPKSTEDPVEETLPEPVVGPEEIAEEPTTETGPLQELRQLAAAHRGKNLAPSGQQLKMLGALCGVLGEHGLPFKSLFTLKDLAWPDENFLRSHFKAILRYVFVTDEKGDLVNDESGRSIVKEGVVEILTPLLGAEIPSDEKFDLPF